MKNSMQELKYKRGDFSSKTGQKDNGIQEENSLEKTEHDGYTQ